MFVRLVLWDLDGAKATIDQLRHYLRDESVDAFASVPGLRFKAWVADRASNRWGAIYLWESKEAAQALMPSRARELIGKDPDVAEWFDLEASVQGGYSEAAADLSRRGLAFEPADGG
jgi:hypothetical protein